MKVFIVFFFLLWAFQSIAQENTLSNKEIYYVEKTFSTVERAIDRVSPKMDKVKKRRLAILITMAANKYSIDPRVMIAIMKIESLFDQEAYNPSGDHSIAQINYKIWSKEFEKLDRPVLMYNRLKKDDAYAIFRMAEILDIERKRFEGKKWHLTYHSRTKKYRDRYEKRYDKEFIKMKTFGSNILHKFPKDNLKVANYFLERP